MCKSFNLKAAVGTLRLYWNHIRIADMMNCQILNHVLHIKSYLTCWRLMAAAPLIIRLLWKLKIQAIGDLRHYDSNRNSSESEIHHPITVWPHQKQAEVVSISIGITTTAMSCSPYINTDMHPHMPAFVCLIYSSTGFYREQAHINSQTHEKLYTSNVGYQCNDYCIHWHNFLWQLCKCEKEHSSIKDLRVTDLTRKIFLERNLDFEEFSIDFGHILMHF